MKAHINTNVRLFDLVRYMRSELHEAGLISDDEYTWLCCEASMANDPKGGSPSPRRLEDYDEIMDKLKQAEKENAQLRNLLIESADALESDIEFEREIMWRKICDFIDKLERK